MQETQTALGFTRTPSEDDPRRDPQLLVALEQIAPGTLLRQAIDDIIRSREGALIVVGEPDHLKFLYSGGMRLDQPFTPQLLYEVAKMDGAIVVDPRLAKIAYANVQLMPDPTIASEETGTRHRTAERVAKQTGALVISISQQRSTISVYIGQARYQLDAVPEMLAKANQAVATLETYRQRLEQVLTRLTALEFQNAVVLDDVLVVLQRAEMTTRMAAEIQRDCVELGAEGRLIRMQLSELIGDVPAERTAVVFDYHVDGAGPRAQLALEGLTALSYRELLEFDRIATLLGYRDVNPLDHSVSPRGFRILSHIPRLPEQVIRQVVTDMDGLEAILRASQRDLEAIAGVGTVRAREIREGLRRLQEHNLVDRYLQL
ncbi:MAG: DNA integrity scanning protein DisA [Actinobacteria bacterium]|nr:MAG: DNA integrity scanning protein DisA [Actinomycetota bacterium]